MMRSVRYLVLSVVSLACLTVSMTGCLSPVAGSVMTRSGEDVTLSDSLHSINQSAALDIQTTSVVQISKTAALVEAAARVKPTKATRPTTTATTKPTTKPTTTAPTTAATTTTITTTTTTTKTTYTKDQWISELVRLVNVERTNAGVPTLSAGNSNLLAAAAVRAEELVISFSHIRPDGSGWDTVLVDFSVPYGIAGENILEGPTGYMTPVNVMQLWMSSEGHRSNIINPGFKSLGIGYYQAGGNDHLVQLFIS